MGFRIPESLVSIANLEQSDQVVCGGGGNPYST